MPEPHRPNSPLAASLPESPTGPWINGPVRLADLDAASIIGEIARPSGPEGPRLFASLNAHGLDLALRDPDYRRLLNQSHLCFCDGFGVLLLYRFWGFGRVRHRNTPTDFLPALLGRLAREEKTVYLLGDTEEVATTFAAWVSARHPGLVAGHHHGFFTLGDAVDERIVGEINRLRPHAVLVGMGNPRQEVWAATHAAKLHCSALVMIGASMAFLAGKRPRGPRWATDRGLEWLFRLLLEPRKLWHRYLVELPRLAWRLRHYRRCDPGKEGPS